MPNETYLDEDGQRVPVRVNAEGHAVVIEVGSTTVRVTNLSELDDLVELIQDVLLEIRGECDSDE